jgi:putative ABC transport system substrate-binding protein
MRRRVFIAIIGGATLTGALPLRAQQSRGSVIGFLRSTSASDSTFLVAAFRQGLKEAGEIDGLSIEYRWGEGASDRLPALATDLASRPVAAIAAAGNEALIAAKAATATIPIVFALGDDPVRLGFVSSLNRPEGNITGVTFETTELAAKRVELLRELKPGVAIIGYLMNPNSVGSDVELREVQRATHALGQQLVVAKVSGELALEDAFDTLAKARAGALLVGSGAFFLGQRDRLAALTARHALPAIYDQRGYIEAGGLLSYGASITDAYRQVGIYVGRILKGENPADLPVIQSSKIEFAINLKTAKALNLEISPVLIARADEVIE